MYFLTGPWNINEQVTFTHFGLYCVRRNITLGGYKSRGETLNSFKTRRMARNISIYKHIKNEQKVGKKEQIQED